MNVPLITPNELLAFEPTQSLVVFDCRFDLMNPSAGRQAYAAGHIPGAHYLSLDDDLSDHSIPLAGRHPLPSPEAFEELMCKHGVGPDTHIVAYDHGDHAMAARLWWLARYFGHSKVQVLNGGVNSWQTQGLSLTEQGTALPAAPGLFEANVQPHMRIQFDELRGQQAGLVLLDARDQPRYRGEVEPIDPVAGHIPGALNMPWKTNLGNDGLFKTPDALLDMWEPYVAAVDRTILYCGSGVTACVNLLALACLGHDDVRLFAGSWSEWCQRGGPVEKS
ncbi:MAG TPA: sulfurtransferase [Limnobacter sp.]|uniref:sulfurtransferase n=1 Tax=Limnobacter sp. TaxID=2003368 RepID=UPI002EDB3CF6